jgi:hypothetical protein
MGLADAEAEHALALGQRNALWGSRTRLSVLTWASMQLARTR